MNGREFQLLGLCFILGIITMALEVSGFRVLAPYFGYSVYVSGGLIGIVMVAMSIGYYVGGWLCNKNVEKWLRIVILASTALYLVFLLFYQTILKQLIGLGEVQGSVISSLILFAPSMALLSATTPMIIAMLSKKGKEGLAASRVYAISTVGSVIGVFLATFVMIPLLGTRMMLNLGFIALVAINIALFKGKNLAVALLLLSLILPFAIGEKEGDYIFYKDSPYNIVKVKEYNSRYFLILNQDNYTQSMYDPNQVLSNNYYDFFNLAPFLLDRNLSNDPSLKLLVLGMGAGTSMHQFKHFFPSATIDAVEIDPVVIDVGRKYFDIGNLSNVTEIIDDGRPFVKNTNKVYDMVEVDVYTGGAYAPFYMLTQEFFDELSRITSDDGVLMMNMLLIDSKTKAAGEYLSSVVSTISTRFQSVYEVPFHDNVIIFASKRNLTAMDIQSAFIMAPITPRYFQLMGVTTYAVNNGQIVHNPSGQVFVDDNAPVEQFTHRIISERNAK